MFLLGEYVKIKDTNIYGYINKLNNKQCTISVNDKYVITDIIRIEKTSAISKSTNNRKKVNITLSSDPQDEIMLRHQTVQEALSNLDKFIDNAICNNISIIKIVHGKQGGVLRKEVQKYLDTHPSIKEHRLGGYYEGSYGVTIAFIR